MIRVSTSEDWEAIIEIYNQAIAEGGCTADLDSVSVDLRKSWLELHTPNQHPIIVSQSTINKAQTTKQITGWCSISPYRSGRKALDGVAEISYYIHRDYRKQGIASELIQYAIDHAGEYGIHSYLAILLDINTPSVKILEKFGFERWGHFPEIATIEEGVCGQFVYGLKIP